MGPLPDDADSPTSGLQSGGFYPRPRRRAGRRSRLGARQPYPPARSSATRRVRGGDGGRVRYLSLMPSAPLFADDNSSYRRAARRAAREERRREERRREIMETLRRLKEEAGDATM